MAPLRDSLTILLDRMLAMGKLMQPKKLLCPSHLCWTQFFL